MNDTPPALPPALASFPAGGVAVVAGATGGLGAAMAAALEASGRFGAVVRASRSGTPATDITDEPSVARLAEAVRESGQPLRLVVVATGFLHGGSAMPEKAVRELDPANLARAFAVNAIGPALLMKHLLPLLPREGKSVLVAISARVGSIGDNHLGGWYGYRASKAALNQLVRTAAVEMRRTRPQAAVVALHPGTVDTALSAPFSRAGLNVRPPSVAAGELLAVIERLTPDDSGSFLDYRGNPVPW
jgi:NAD(P)-dependent dehydrogenase (short-subunit alcohol dehydrogenase family)